jgi:hypothetical protein
MREAAAFLREHPPPDVEQQELDEYLDAIEAPVRRPVQQRFRSLVRSAQEGNSEAEVAQQIVDTADKLGLEPTDPVEALPPISTDDIHLVCWMAITPAEGETEAT